MYSLRPAQLSVLLGLTAVSQGLLLEPDTLQENLLPTYDYVIVGGGPAGLVLANRLSEDASINVLVLEAGPMDKREAGITIPSGIGAEVGSQYDWNLTTVAQTSLDGTARSLSQGHAVAGGTLLNGMIWTRGTQADYDAWETLGNDGWGWEDMVPYFQKVEKYTNNLAGSKGLDVTLSPDSSIYGQSGSVQVGYPDFFYSQFSNFVEGNVELGLDLANDTSGGTNVGVTVPVSSISATNQSRSDARASYLDSAIGRTNLHIAPEQRVTGIILNTADSSADPIAEGVKFVSASDTTRVLSINATREVILSAGAIWTPILMQVSGIGPSAVLTSLGITTLVDLVGVGSNLHDHGMVDPNYAYSAAGLFSKHSLTGTTLEQAESEYYNNRTGALTATLIEAIAYLPLSTLSDSYEALLSNLSSADPNTYLPSDYPDEVRTGYAAQYAALVKSLGSDVEGAVEIMSNSVGTIQVTSQRPFSRGTVRPVSSSIIDGAAIDPRYCSNPFDRDVIVMGLEWNARLIQTASMQKLSPAPEAALTSNDRAQLEAFVNSGLGTEFHPCGTTAMMPRESGGVVDTELNVYGVQNLRSVSSASIPLIPSAHLQAVVYALAEKAADIIIAAQSAGPDAGSSNTTSTAAAATSSSITSPATSAATTTTAAASAPTTATTTEPTPSDASTTTAATTIAATTTAATTAVAPTSATGATDNSGLIGDLTGIVGGLDSLANGPVGELGAGKEVTGNSAVVSSDDVVSIESAAPSARSKSTCKSKKRRQAYW